MEWDSNPSSNWDVVNKFEVQDNNNNNNNNYHQHLGAIASCATSGMNRNMFSVDLKLGRLEDRRDLSVVKNSGTLTMTTSTSSRTRGRVRNTGAQTTVYCSVDGCNSDLNQCREYHRRHRVCERHSKTPVVLICGKEQRFCQQCSRFHSLGEFDEVKRSCRKRLDGHNRRRRKTQPETFYMNSANLHSSSHTGNGMLQFGTQQMHTTTTTATTSWPTISQPEKTPMIYNHYDPLANNDLSRHSGFVNHQQFLNDCIVPTSTDCNNSRSKEMSLKVSPDRLFSTQPTHKECALSLLSRYPPAARSSSSSSASSSSTSSVQGFGSGLQLTHGLAHQFAFAHKMEDETSAASLLSSNVNGHNFGGFPSGNNGFCANTSSRMFPFSWG